MEGQAHGSRSQKPQEGVCLNNYLYDHLLVHYFCFDLSTHNNSLVDKDGENTKFDILFHACNYKFKLPNLTQRHKRNNPRIH